MKNLHVFDDRAHALVQLQIILIRLTHHFADRFDVRSHFFRFFVRLVDGS